MNSIDIELASIYDNSVKQFWICIPSNYYLACFCNMKLNHNSKSACIPISHKAKFWSLPLVSLRPAWWISKPVKQSPSILFLSWIQTATCMSKRSRNTSTASETSNMKGATWSLNISKHIFVCCVFHYISDSLDLVQKGRYVDNNTQSIRHTPKKNLVTQIITLVRNAETRVICTNINIGSKDLRYMNTNSSFIENRYG